jgi:hypothetical protein
MGIIRKLTDKIELYNPKTGEGFLHYDENNDKVVSNKPVDAPSVSTETAKIDALDAPAIDVKGVSDFAQRGADEVLVEQAPNNPSTGAARWHFHDDPGSSVYIGRYHKQNDTSHEVLKFNSNGQVALEAEGPGKLRLQSSSQPTGTYGVTTGIGISLETHDSGGSNKVPRLEIAEGQDTVNLDVENANRFGVQNDTPFTVGGNQEGELRYDSTDSAVILDVPASPKTAQVEIDSNKVFEFTKFNARLKSATLDLDNGRLRKPRVLSNDDGSNLQSEEIAIDDNRGGTGTTALLYKDSSGTTHYWDADGTL